MHDHYLEGFNQRFPGGNKPKVSRKGLTSAGPWREISGDGHEKMSELALQMGEVGLPIYGFKDKWSAFLLMLITVPDCRTAAAMGYIYLDLIEE